MSVPPGSIGSHVLILMSALIGSVRGRCVQRVRIGASAVLHATT